jgi:DNA-binding HxlR family transcriptional regulator
VKLSGAKQQRSSCPISIALEALGDTWSLLIIRDLMFKGRKTFKEFLEADEGIASNILTDRLQRLEALAIITKRPDPEDARRLDYRLTEVGIELAPTLLELILWSAKHFKTGAPPEILEQMINHRKKFLAQVRKTWAQTGDVPNSVEGLSRWS